MGHILVVDDEPAIATVVRERLEREGFAVRAVASGEEALAHMDGDPADLVLDVMLPGWMALKCCAACGAQAIRCPPPCSPPGTRTRQNRSLELGVVRLCEHRCCSLIEVSPPRQHQCVRVSIFHDQGDAKREGDLSMNIQSSKVWPLLASLGLIALTVMCTPTVDEVTPTPTSTPTPTAPEPTASPTPTLTPTPLPPPASSPPTPTPTPLPPPSQPSPTPTLCPCDGLSGAIEVQVLVGPAEAVGLEPFAVGSIPFTVACGTVQGAGHVAYQDILTKEWGTYKVTLNLDIAVNGECGEDAGLDVALDLAGSQYVEVTAEGFHGEYPWEGEHSFPLSFPLQDGAIVQGEGWAFVLRLHSQ
jgi:hypothetical protein